jgi:5-methyltetrahydrofolate--homocysteine methyltransferase
MHDSCNQHPYDTDLLDTLSRRVMIGGGATGTQLQAAELTLDDFLNLEGCNENRPVVIEMSQRNCFDADAHAHATKYVRLQSG